MTMKPWDSRIAHFFIRPFHRLPIHPNFVTTLSMVASVASGICFAMATPVLIIIAPALYILGNILDHADGELARLTGKSSTFGHYYDHVAGAIGYLSLFIGLGIGLRGEALGAYAIPFGITAGVASVLTMGIRLRIEARSGVCAHDQPSFAGFEVEDFMYVVAPFTWLGYRDVFLTLAAVGSTISLLITLRAMYQYDKKSKSATV